MKVTRSMIAVFGLFLLAQTAQADWTTAKRLTWTSENSYSPAIAVDSNGHIHLVWYDGADNREEIYYRRSEDGGTTWSAAKRLTWTKFASCSPAIAIDSSNAIHVVWFDTPIGDIEIYYTRSTDGGTTWSAAKRLTWTSGVSYVPAIAIDSNDTIHIVWQDDTPGTYEIYYKRSKDGGTTWSAAKRLTWTTGTSHYPAIAIDSIDTIHLVWYDTTPGNAEIYYKSSADKGLTWSAAQRITWTSGDSDCPVIAIDLNDAIHVVWNRSTPDYDEIYYKSSADRGVTWSVAKRLTWTSGLSGYPAIAIDASNAIHVVWEDSTPGNMEIYYKTSSDGGTTWSAAQRITWTSGDSRCPVMAIDAINTIHVVWYDDTPGNNEIYYKNGN
jgi:hypothetical protein